MPKEVALLTPTPLQNLAINNLLDIRFACLVVFIIIIIIILYGHLTTHQNVSSIFTFIIQRKKKIIE